MAKTDSIDELARLYEQQFEKTRTPAGYLVTKPCAPSCGDTRGLLAYLSAESITTADLKNSSRRLQCVRRLHDTLGNDEQRRTTNGLDWDGAAWCNPIREGLAVVVARYVHRRLSEPDVPEVVRLPRPRGVSPFEYGKTIAMGNIFKFTLERRKNKNVDPGPENLPDHVSYIRHDLEVIKPKVILLFGKNRKNALETLLRGEAPPIIAVSQPQRPVNSSYLQREYDAAGREVMRGDEELSAWMKGVKVYGKNGHRLLGEAARYIDELIARVR